MTEVLPKRTDLGPLAEGVATLAMAHAAQLPVDVPRPGEVEHLPLVGHWWEDDRYLTVID